MNDWQIIPEILGCNASLRRAAVQAMDTVQQGCHLAIEGETGSGRRLLARSAWSRRAPGARSLFTLDCHMFGKERAEHLLFGDTSGARATLYPGGLPAATTGGLLLLHAEELAPKTQSRLARALDPRLCRSRNGGPQLIVTCATSFETAIPLDADLSALLRRVRLPALRERVEDIRLIAEAFLRDASPFKKIRCSQALIERFCGYDWPGNITELRSVLRRLLLEPHNGLLDVRHLADLMCRDETSFALVQGMPPLGPTLIENGFFYRAPSPEDRRVQ